VHVEEIFRDWGNVLDGRVLTCVEREGNDDLRPIDVYNRSVACRRDIFREARDGDDGRGRYEMNLVPTKRSNFRNTKTPELQLSTPTLTTERATDISLTWKFTVDLFFCFGIFLIFPHSFNSSYGFISQRGSRQRLA
jgi:hypothetical protein